MSGLRKSAVVQRKKTPLIRAAGDSVVPPSGKAAAGAGGCTAIAITLFGGLEVRADGDAAIPLPGHKLRALRSEEHTSELQSLMRISYAVFCLKQKKKTHMYSIIH